MTTSNYVEAGMGFNLSQLMPSEPLTGWKNEPNVMALKEDLDIAKQNHDAHVTRVKHWLDLRNVTGSARPKVVSTNRSKVQPKLIRRQAEWRYAALSEPFLSADKLFKVSPSTWEDVKGASQNALILAWQFRTKIDRIKFIDELVRTLVDEGSAFVRLGWRRETREVEETIPVLEFYEVSTQEEMQLLEQAMQLKQQNPTEFMSLPDEVQEAVNYTLESGIPVSARVIGAEKVKVDKVVRNHPTLDIISYENIYIDPSCDGELDTAKFAVVSFETSKADLIKDGRYKNLNKVNWESNSPLVHPDHASPTSSQAENFKDQLRRPVVAYEYWGWYDIHKTNVLVPIVATWIGDTMIRMEENPFPDQKIPVVCIPYSPLKRSVTGEPDAELLEENQAILGAVTRGMLDLLGRSANGQTGFAKGMLDPVNRRRYDKGIDYEFNTTVSPAAGIHQHKYPELPNSALTILSLQNQEAEALTGVKAFSGGLSGEAYGEVAAGIRGMLDAASKREMGIIRRIGSGLEKIASKIISMNQVFLEEEEVVRVTNEQFVSVRREDLAGDYDLEVDISTAEVDAAQAQDLSFMLQTMGNSMEFSMTQLILAKIAKLKRMPDLAEQIEQFQPQPDPMQEQLKQLELQKLQKEIEELDSKINYNNARASEALAKKDKTDLDFLEQETGTTHARDMDRQGAQADANKELEVTKAMLNTMSQAAMS